MRARLRPRRRAAADVIDRPVLRARVVMLSDRAPMPADRYAVLPARCRRLPSARRAWRCASTCSSAVRRARLRPGGALPHWGQWERTDRPGIVGFVFTKRVEQLAAPAVLSRGGPLSLVRRRRQPRPLGQAAERAVPAAGPAARPGRRRPGRVRPTAATSSTCSTRAATTRRPSGCRSRWRARRSASRCRACRPARPAPSP